MKRLCVKKLPSILAIQLKRFEYDYERLCPINDYFQFPRVLGTVWGIAKAEGQVNAYTEEEANSDICTCCQLTGIVFHIDDHYYLVHPASAST